MYSLVSLMSLVSSCSSPAPCAGEGCASGTQTWPLFRTNYRDVNSHLCSTCLLLSYRSLYCCCCLLILGSSPAPHNDPLTAPPAPTATCRICHEAVAHLSCLQNSASDIFVCPSCSAATTGKNFSYEPSLKVLALANRMSLALLRKSAPEIRAQWAAEAANERKQAYCQPGLAHGIDPKLPSIKDDILPPVNLGPECSRANMGIALDLLEPAPPPSLGTLAIEQYGVCTETAMRYANPPPLSLATYPTGMEGVCRVTLPSTATLAIGQEGVSTELTMASAKPPDNILPPVNLGPECSRANMGIALDLLEPAPPPSPGTLAIEQYGVCTETAMRYAHPPPLSLATYPTGMEGVCRVTPPSPATLAIGQEGVSTELTMASAEPPDDILPPVNLGPECSRANMGIALDLLEPAPPPSPGILAIEQYGVCTETAMRYANLPPLSLATYPTGMEGVCRVTPPSPATLAIGQEGISTELTMASAEPPLLSLATPATRMEGVCRVTLPFPATLEIGQEGVSTELEMASPPLLSLATPATRMEGVSTELTMASAEPPLLSLATPATRMEGVCRGKGKAVASAEAPPRQTLQLFWSGIDEEDDE